MLEQDIYIYIAFAISVIINLIILKNLFFGHKKANTSSKRASHRELQRILTIRMENPSKAGYEFEKFVRDMYLDVGLHAELAVDMKRKGNYPTLLLKGKGDGGADIIAFKEDIMYVIQSKLYAQEVKKEVIASLKMTCDIFQNHYKNKKIVPVVFCWSGMDNTAIAFAKSCDCIMYDEDSIRDFINS